MKILAVVHGYLPTLAAGSERMLQHLLAPLVAAGHEVRLWSLHDADEVWDIDGVRCEGGTPAANAWDPDVVITHHELGSRYTKYLQSLGSFKTVVIFHNERYFIDTSMKLNPDFCVYNTSWVRESLDAEWFPRPGMVVHPPLDAARHLVPAIGRRVTLINLSDNKGVHVFGKLLGRMTDVEFLGVEGTHGGQDYYAGNVEYLSTQQDMREVWQRTGILLVPSGYESYGMVAAEAAVNGIPVIAHPTPGLQECLGDAGLFIDRDDVGSWDRMIRRLLDSPEFYRKTSAAVRQRGAALVDQTERELKDWQIAIEGLVTG